MKVTLLNQDMTRYEKRSCMPKFQYWFRKYQGTHNYLLKIIYKIFYRVLSNRNHIEIPCDTQIGGGLYIGHPFGIIINPKAVLGKNCNIHKGVTVGQENKGKRKGAPIIGNCVWIGINSAIVGNVTIGDDVLIAPNSYVNCDIPSHSVVFGNPCIIKSCENATENYINRKTD